MTRPARDKWAEWLLERRHGGNPEDLEATLNYLYPVRNRVLDNAGIGEGDVVLDVGAGDGLIAFGALERVGNLGAVIFSDVSQDLLDHARSLAEETGVIDRCSFIYSPPHPHPTPGYWLFGLEYPCLPLTDLPSRPG